MDIEQIITILKNKVDNLNFQITNAIARGELEEVESLNIELSKTEKSISKLETLI